MMTLPEIAGVFGIIVGAVLTIFNIRKAMKDAGKERVAATLEASTLDEQRLTIVANSAQVATSFLQDVLKRADKEIEARDQRIDALEQEVRELRATVAELQRRLGV